MTAKKPDPAPERPADDVKAKFAEALARKQEQQHSDHGDGSRNSGKGSAAHGPAGGGRREFRRKAGG